MNPNSTKPNKVLVVGAAGGAARNGLAPTFNRMAAQFFGTDHGIQLLGCDIKPENEDLRRLYDRYHGDMDITVAGRKWDSILPGVDLIVNATMAPPNSDEPTQKRIHVDGMRNLCTLAQKHGVPRIVHFSTFSVYEDPPYNHYVEKMGKILTEDTVECPPSPRSTYARTKYGAEEILRQYVTGAEGDGTPIEGAVGVFTGITSTCFPPWGEIVKQHEWLKMQYALDHIDEKEARQLHVYTNVLDVGRFAWHLGLLPPERVFIDINVPIETYFCSQDHPANSWSINKAKDRLGYVPEFSLGR